MFVSQNSKWVHVECANGQPPPSAMSGVTTNTTVEIAEDVSSQHLIDVTPPTQPTPQTTQADEFGYPLLSPNDEQILIDACSAAVARRKRTRDAALGDEPHDTQSTPSKRPSDLPYGTPNEVRAASSQRQAFDEEFGDFGESYTYATIFKFRKLQTNR